MIAYLEGDVVSHADEGWGKIFVLSEHYRQVRERNEPITQAIHPAAIMYTSKLAEGLPKLSHVTIYPNGLVIGKRP